MLEAGDEPGLAKEAFAVGRVLAIGVRITLTATVRWSVVSSAFQTSDIPPAPAFSISR